MEGLNELLPELQQWNDGRGIPASDWLTTFARSDQALAYATLFWPRFAVIEGCVLRAPASIQTLKRWKKQSPSVVDNAHIEAMWNTLYIDTLFSAEEWSPLLNRRAAYLGGVLADIYRLKLARDFPERRFIVEFWDDSDPEHGGEVSLSFWQSN